MHGPRLSASVLIAVLVGCGRSTAPTPPSPSGGTTAAITPADLRLRESIFSDDSMQGRRAGTPGNTRGNGYIVRELTRLGLRPAGDSGSFLQRVPLTEYAVDSTRATLQSGRATLSVFHDYFPYQPEFSVPARSIDGAGLVYIGSLSDTARLPSRETLRGKLVLFRSETSGPPLTAPDLGANGRLGEIAGIAITGVDPLLASFDQYLRTPRLEVEADTPPPTGATKPRLLLVPTRTVAALFGKPVESLVVGETGPSVRGNVTFDGTDRSASNVVAVVDGADGALRGEYVALGAHNDAIGIVPPVDHDSLRAYNTVVRPRGANDPQADPTPEQAARIQAIRDSLRKLRPSRIDSIVNGADDDGSGSMALLEIAEALAGPGPKPARSVMLVWHTGEESGLQGSRWFTDHPTVPRDSIVTQLNIDMIGRGGPKDEAKGGPGYLQVIGSRRLSTQLGDLVDQVNQDGKFGFAFDYSYDAKGHPDNFYCRSDHYMYARYGIPIAFFSTGGHRDYHQVTDELQYLDFDKFARVTRFVHDVAIRVANLPARPVVDQPKPDPAAPCHQ